MLPPAGPQSLDPGYISGYLWSLAWATEPEGAGCAARSCYIEAGVNYTDLTAYVRHGHHSEARLTFCLPDLFLKPADVILEVAAWARRIHEYEDDARVDHEGDADALDLPDCDGRARGAGLPALAGSSKTAG